MKIRGMEAPGGPIRDADDKPMEPGPTICIKAPVMVEIRVGFLTKLRFGTSCFFGRYLKAQLEL